MDFLSLPSFSFIFFQPPPCNFRRQYTWRKEDHRPGRCQSMVRMGVPWNHREIPGLTRGSPGIWGFLQGQTGQRHLSSIYELEFHEARWNSLLKCCPLAICIHQKPRCSVSMHVFVCFYFAHAKLLCQFRGYLVVGGAGAVRLSDEHGKPTADLGIWLFEPRTLQVQPGVGTLFIAWGFSGYWASTRSGNDSHKSQLWKFLKLFGYFFGTFWYFLDFLGIIRDFLEWPGMPQESPT